MKLSLGTTDNYEAFARNDGCLLDISRSIANSSRQNNYISYMTQKGGHVYILTNQRHTVLYIGVTADLHNRIYQHKNKIFEDSFTNRYNVNKLVYYEDFSGIAAAIEREKQLKNWPRKRKETLINSTNPDWKDLWEDVQHWY